MMTTTKIPSLRPTILMTQRLIESASRDAAIGYARLGHDIQNGLLSIEEEIEKYAVAELLEELGTITSTTAQEKEVWSVEEAAAYYGVGKRTLQNMISRFKQKAMFLHGCYCQQKISENTAYTSKNLKNGMHTLPIGKVVQKY